MARDPYEPRKFPKVERWRPFVRQHLAHVPEDFVLAWIRYESGGKPGSSSGLDERGILQIHPSEADGMGLSEADWDYLQVPETSSSYDAGKHFRISAKLIAHKEAAAKGHLKKFGVRFTGQDYWTLVKLEHGLPSIISKGFPAFELANGRAPTTFAEFASWVRRTGFKVGNYTADRVSEIIGNAERVGKWAGGSLGTVMLIAAAVAVLWTVL